MCEAILDYAIDFPGIQILVVRQRHTSIVETTKKTMMREVLGPIQELIAGEKKSQGEDWVELKPTGRIEYEDGSTREIGDAPASRINFIGLDDPVKWYSSEVGVLVFDEAHEIAEQDVVQLMTRLRQKGMPHHTLIGFNPGNPGHWLQEWFILGASQTQYGFYKKNLIVTGAESPIGDCEFVFANAYDNPHLPEGYIERTLKSLPVILRRRLLNGEWVLSDGSLFFDADALTAYQAELVKPWKTGETAGDPRGNDPKDLPRVKLRADGPLAVWKPPVRAAPGVKAHRYVVSVDVSSGGGADYTGVQVIDIDLFEQVAELQVKLDPDLAAIEAYRLACIYNGGLIVPEVTGGYGDTIVRVVQRLNLNYKGPLTAKPTLYQRILGQNQRLDPDYTTRFGWDTNTHTRMLMLDALEEALRERSFKLYGTRTHTELTHFARDEKGRPAAVSGRHDDLTISLAIGVYVASQLPKEIRRPRQTPHVALVGQSGY